MKRAFGTVKKLWLVIAATTIAALCAVCLVACGGGDKGYKCTTHLWGSSYISDADGHYKQCIDCGEKDYSEHSYDSDDKCICGQKRIVAEHEHDWVQEWEITGTQHWHKCTVEFCREKDSYGEHDFIDGDCVCGQPRPTESKCLIYKLNDDEKGYAVDGVSNENEKYIAIPAEHEGKPVTRINWNAFKYCKALEAITIPDSIDLIASAFSDCKNLKKVYYTGDIASWCEVDAYNITSYGRALYIDGKEVVGDLVIPDGVKTLNGASFRGCKGLTSAIIPDSVTSIGYYTFSGCSGLTSVTIGKGVTNIWGSAFIGCSSLSSVYYTGDMAGWCGIEYRDSDANPLSLAHNLYINNKLVTELVIPETVTEIKDYAFIGGSCFTSIEIQNSVTSIGISAFSNCSNLASIEISNSVDSIGKSAFLSCNKITTATLPTTAVSSIPKTQLQTVVINGGEAIGDYAFSRCGSLTSIEIPNSVRSIGIEAFLNCYRLDSIEIPASVKEVSGSAFDMCFELKNVTIRSDGLSVAFPKCPIENATIPTSAIGGVSNSNLKTVKIISGARIPRLAFYGSSSLASVELSDSVTSIGEYAFNDRRELKNIVIPDSVTRIEKGAFDNCESLQYNEYENGLYLGNSQNPYLVLVKAKDTSITYCTIKENTKIAYYGAFAKCERLSSVYYLGDISSWCGITFCNYDSTPVYYSKNLYIDNELITEELVLPNTVTEIKAYTLRYCDSITRISIPNSVTSIGDYALPYGKELQYNEYGNGLYLGNSENPYLVLINVKNKDATSFSINENTKFIHSGAFYRLYKLTSVVIPDGVTGIGSYAFYECTGLDSIKLPNSLTNIGDNAFDSCNKVANIEIPNNVTSIGSYAFSYCSGLTSIVLPSSVTSIGDGVFAYCQKLKSIEFEGTMQQWRAIEKYEWSYISSVKTIVCTDGTISV